MTTVSAPARTGSHEAPASIRRGVIRRRLRLVFRVAVVLVLALSMAVLGAIRSGQEARANPALLAPLAPVMIASGPPGWIVGGAVMLGAVVATDAIRRDAEDGEMFWEGSGDRWRDLIGGTQEWWNNLTGEQAPKTEQGGAADPNGGFVKMNAAFGTKNYRETTSSAGRRQLTVDVTYSGPFDGYGRAYEVFGVVKRECRNQSTGQRFPQIEATRLAYSTSYNGNGSTSVWGTPGYGNTMYSAACAGEDANAKPHQIIKVEFTPMTRKDWDKFGASSPTTYQYSYGKNDFYLFPDYYKETTGYRTTVTCKLPDGSFVTARTTSKDIDGLSLPGCGDGTVDDLTVERVNDAGAPVGAPVATADVVGHREVGVVVDGQACVMGREGCADWTAVRASSPERVQCVSGGQVIASQHCNLLEGFYKNGGTVVHPDNVDGNPATYYDPWKNDPSFTGVYQKPDGTYAPAPARPSVAPSPVSPKPWNPYTDPTSPVYDPDYDPATDPEPQPETPEPLPTAPATVPPDLDPDYDPRKDPQHPDYDPRYDPEHPSYDPLRDPSSPDYDPYYDPDSPLYDPDYDPHAPEPEPEPSPTAPAEPEPSPTGDPQPEPTQEPEPEPTQEPTEDPGEGEEPEPGEEPSAEPTAEPTMEPQPEEAEPPLPPRPQSVDVDEDGHLLPLSAAVATMTQIGPGGSMVYTEPATGLQTIRAADGTKTTTIYHTPVGTDTPQKIETVQTPDGTKTTTQPGYPLIVTPGNMSQAPSTGTIPIAPPGVDPAPPGGGTPGAGDPRPPSPEPPGSDQQNCMAGAYSWNPIHWVYVPVKCALTWAFKPDAATFDTNVKNTLKVYEGKGVGPMIENYDRTIQSIPLGGDGCMGPPLTVPALGGMTPPATYYLFNACDDMAPMAAKTNMFGAFVISVMGGLSVIRALASGFGFSFKPAPESDWYAPSK